MLTIRLRRQGARNNPFYRVVLNDSRRTPRARALEELGYYDPTRNPKVLSLKEERIEHWVGQGAIVSETLKKLRKKGVSAEAVALKGLAAPAASVPEVAEEAPAVEAAADETPAEEASEVEAAPADAAPAEETPAAEEASAEEPAQAEEA